MTANQLAYLQYEEARRANFARENEMNRSNLANEALTGRRIDLDSQRHGFDVSKYENEAYLRNLQAIRGLVDVGSTIHKAKLDQEKAAMSALEFVSDIDKMWV